LQRLRCVLLASATVAQERQAREDAVAGQMAVAAPRIAPSA